MRHSSTSQQRVVGLLVLLFGITYLDRVCISVAGPRMQEDLHIGSVGWGWVTGVFSISYCLFEIPSGILGDRIGPRRVLTRIVLWWSGFTALTGLVTSYYPLLVTRFLFGAGEAGAFPNASVVVSRWFPPQRRATMCGVLLMAGQVGGALSPLLVVPLQSRFGWRASFFVFGALGVCWSLAWHVWFRDHPTEVRGPAQSDKAEQAEREEWTEQAGRPEKAERAGRVSERLDYGEAAERSGATGHSFPWRSAFRSGSVLALVATAFCYVYVYNFFQTWFHTFLVKGRGFNETGLWLSALPYVVGVLGNLTGGAVSDLLVVKLGRRRGRRTTGAAALTVAGVFTIAAMLTRQQLLTVAFLAVVYGAIAFQQSAVFGVCLDIGKRHAGAMVGLMNTAAQLGGLVGAVAYGYLIERFGNYDAPFVPMAAVLFLGAMLWLRIDASQELQSEPGPRGLTATSRP